MSYIASAVDWNPALDELERQRDELNDLIFRIRRIAGMDPGPQARSTPAAAAAAAVHKKRISVRKAAGPVHKTPEPVHQTRPAEDEPRCAKHPENTEFSSRGNCEECKRDKQREYQRKWAAKKSKSVKSSVEAEPASAVLDRVLANALRQPPAVAATPPSQEGNPPDEERPEFVYSVKTRCPKCSNITRMSRAKDADLKKDNWTCMFRACQIRISHIILGVDKHYSGAAA